MRPHHDIPVDLQLIGKYLSGEASPEEALAIDLWRDESPENNRIFETTTRLWNELSGGNQYRQPQNIDKWLELKEDIEKRHKHPRSPISKRLFTRGKIAAAVLVLLGAATLFYLLRTNSRPFTYKQVALTEKNIVTDTLPDFSTITLFRNSRLSIQDQFAKSGRKVLLDGEGFFQVKPLRTQPFVIYTGGIKIIVLGTEFNVKNNSEKVTVSVNKGKVKMQKDSSGIFVTTGSTGIFYKTGQRFVLYTDSLNVNSYSYATREIYFNNASLKEVKEVLENMYHIKVTFENDSLENLRINTQFRKQPLDYVLKVISASLGIQYRLKNDTLYFLEEKPQ